MVSSPTKLDVLYKSHLTVVVLVMVCLVSSNITFLYISCNFASSWKALLNVLDVVIK